MNTTQSLWDLIFGGEIYTNIFISLCLVGGILMLYCFLQKYFYLKSFHQKNTNFIDNIADCIYDKRIESAQDLCKRTSSAESRMVAKGLLRIEKPFTEISSAVKSQRELEIAEIGKDLHRIAILPKIVFLLGIAGSFFSLVWFFWKDKELAFQNPHFYTFAVPATIASILAIFGMLMNVVIRSLFQKAEIGIRNSSIRFLEIINDNQ